MKPSSFSRVAIAAAWLLLIGVFTSRQTAATQNIVVHQNTHYYYYLADDDSYDQFSNMPNEITHLEQLLGVYVDTNPFGGTLVARGYLNNAYPHNIWPSSYLYTH